MPEDNKTNGSNAPFAPNQNTPYQEPEPATVSQPVGGGATASSATAPTSGSAVSSSQDVPTQPGTFNDQQSTQNASVPAQPAPAFGTSSSNPAPIEEPKKSHKKRNIIILLVALLVLVGAAVAAYFLWYQKPEKVVSDAVMNVIKAKTATYTGSLAITGEQNVKIEIDGKNTLNAGDFAARATFTVDGKEFKVDGSFRSTSDGTAYFKFDNVKELVDSYFSSLGVSSSSFDSLISKIDGKWVKVTVSDMDTLNPEAKKTRECTNTAVKQLTENQDTQKELADIYKKNAFLAATNDLPSQTINSVDSMGYTITADEAKFKSFITAINDTKIMKDLQACDSSIKLNADDFKSTEESKNTKLRVWVGRFTHEFTRVELEGTSDGAPTKFIMDPKFNGQVTVDAPQDAITIEELQKEVEKAFSELQSDFITNYEASAEYSYDAV